MESRARRTSSNRRRRNDKGCGCADGKQWGRCGYGPRPGVGGGLTGPYRVTCVTSHLAIGSVIASGAVMAAMPSPSMARIVVRPTYSISDPDLLGCARMYLP